MLTVVYTLTDALSSERVPPEQLREELGSLRVLGSSIAGLAKQLVGLGKGQGAARPVDLGQLVAASRPMLQNLAGKAVTVRVEATEGVVVNADATRLEQALMNLVINARDAVEGEGTVEIEVRSPAPGRATLRVTDDGAGIPPELRAKIFDPFFTTKATERGTGLGLMVVEQVAREIGGTVSVDSSPGKGTTFELHLPAINTSVPASTTVDEMGAEVVLLVDDDEAVRELVARGLRRLGYTVLESADGELALRLSERHKGPIDVLLTDGKIPRRSGPELAAAMRGHRPGIKQVLITGDQVIAPPELFDARIEKPCTASEVARVIRTVLRKT
jgi:CheY-like chemotaxis protein/two-component sensor histidine kinase